MPGRYPRVPCPERSDDRLASIEARAPLRTPTLPVTRGRRDPDRPPVLLALPGGRLLLRLATVTFAAVALASFVIAPLVAGRPTGKFEDFDAYLGAARDMARGLSPYAHFHPDASVVMSGFDYPPPAAVVVRALALVPANVAAIAWLWLGLGCTVAGALIVARTVLPERWPRVQLALLFALAFAPATYNYWHGQVNPLIFLLIALAFRAWVRGEEVAAGVFVGLAAALKLAPLVLVVLFVRRRWWRGVAAATLTLLAGCGLAMAVVGSDALVTFVTRVLPALTRETGWVYNQSLSGLLSRLADHSVVRLEPADVRLHLTSLGASAAAIAVAAAAVRRHRDGGERAVEFGIGVTAMLLASSIAWYPHFVHLLVPLAAAVALAARRGWVGERHLVAAALAVTAVFGVLVSSVLAHLDTASLVRLEASAVWWPVLQLASIPALVVVAFLVAQLRALSSASRGATVHPGPVSRGPEKGRAAPVPRGR